MLQQKFRQPHTLFYYLLKFLFLFSLIFPFFSLSPFPLRTNKNKKTKIKKKQNQGGFNWMSLVNLGLRLMLSTLNNGGSGVAGGLDKADSQSGSTEASLSQVYLTIIF